MNLKDENKLINKVQKYSDKAAANKLISHYYSEIYAFVYKQTVDLELSMDLTQNIFIAVLQSISGYDTEKARFRTWLYRIASNKVMDYYRSAVYQQKHNAVSIDEIDIADDSDMQQTFELEDLTAEALSYICHFDFETQQILRLKIFAEYKFKEISDVLSIPENTVKTKYYNALNKLRKEIKVS